MQYKDEIETSGWFGFVKKVTARFSSWRSINIKIGVTGESGAGKSTFINSIRGLKADDPGAAPVGLVECTMQARRYEFPHNQNVEIWDLPGFGTRRFNSKNDYLKRVHWNTFDAVLLLSSKRFTEHDSWLACEIKKKNPEQQLFFVRTHVNEDIRNFRQSRHKTTPTDIEFQLQTLREDSSKQLKEIGIEDHTVFLIDSHKCNAFDYKKLVKKIVFKANILKKESLILSLAGITDGVIDMKLGKLTKRINDIAKLAGMAGACIDRKGSIYPAEVEIMFKEVSAYREQLGLDLRELKTVAEHLDENMDMLLKRNNLKSYEYGASKEKFACFYRQYDRFQKTLWHSVPMAGMQWKLAEYQTQCEITLKAFLDICADDIRNLQKEISHTIKGSEPDL